MKNKCIGSKYQQSFESYKKNSCIWFSFASCIRSVESAVQCAGRQGLQLFASLAGNRNKSCMAKF